MVSLTLNPSPWKGFRVRALFCLGTEEGRAGMVIAGTVS
jgi:hypothetical protein